MVQHLGCGQSPVYIISQWVHRSVVVHRPWKTLVYVPSIKEGNLQCQMDSRFICFPQWQQQPQHIAGIFKSMGHVRDVSLIKNSRHMNARTSIMSSTQTSLARECKAGVMRERSLHWVLKVTKIQSQQLLLNDYAKWVENLATRWQDQIVKGRYSDLERFIGGSYVTSIAHTIF